jgi:nicotinamide-nucleotide amidase
MDKTKTLAAIGQRLINRNETVAVAESVTAGLMMADFSLAENATEFFQGGIVVYNLGQKTRHLDVEPIHAEKFNCVSEGVTAQMAVEVSKKFCCQWGIGITGYAVPVPELNIKTCFAFYSFAYKNELVTTLRIESTKKGQAVVQNHFAETVLNSFLEILR